VTTGRAVGTARPYATLTRLGSHPLLRSNAGGTIEQIRLRIDLWHDRLDDGQAIVRQIRTSLDGSAFPLSGGDRVMHLRRTEDAAVQHEDGVWQFSMTFLVQVYLAQGV